MARSETRRKEKDERLTRAEWLAKFCNIETADEAEFRKERSEFFPVAWWDYSSDSANPQWRFFQGLLRQAWRNCASPKRRMQQWDSLQELKNSEDMLAPTGTLLPLPDDRRLHPYELVPLLLAVFDPSVPQLLPIAKSLTETEIHFVSVPLTEKIPGISRPAFIGAQNVSPTTPMYPAQQALLFLYEESWRMRVCPCGKFFVANTNIQKFHAQSEKCTAWEESYKNRKAVSSKKHYKSKSAKINRDRRKKYHKEHPTARHRKRAKRAAN